MAVICSVGMLATFSFHASPGYSLATKSRRLRFSCASLIRPKSPVRVDPTRILRSSDELPWRRAVASIPICDRYDRSRYRSSRTTRLPSPRRSEREYRTYDRGLPRRPFGRGSPTRRNSVELVTAETEDEDSSVDQLESAYLCLDSSRGRRW